MRHRAPQQTRHEQCLTCGSTALSPLRGYETVELVRCATCGLVFCERVPTEQELREHYASYDRSKSTDTPMSVRSRESLLGRFEPYRCGGKILDAGCGVGLILDQARARGWDTHGTEFTDEALAVCRAAGHQMRRGLLAEQDFEEGSFDVIVYTEVIEHIYTQREEYEMARKFLRPGGLLYLTTPNFNALSRRIAGPRWNIIAYPEHLAYFTPRTLTRFLESVGFERIWLETTGFSPSRCGHSLGGQEPQLASNPAKKKSRDRRADNLLRAILDSGRLTRTAKQVINRGLTVAGAGDTIKAGFTVS